MYCMKCGREAEIGQVFCPDCLESMKQEPVNMNTAVKLPQVPIRKTAVRRTPIHLEEEVKRLEKSNGRLRAWVLLLATAVILLSMAMFYEEISNHDEPGKNYSIVESADHS